MSEIYWITRLDGVNFVFGFILLVSIVVTGIFLMGYLVNGCKVTERDFTKNNLKTLKRFSLYSILLAVLFVLIPSQRDMYMIYGLGGTIDYIRSNDTAKQLPDKCIQALDKLVDDYIYESKEE